MPYFTETYSFKNGWKKTENLNFSVDIKDKNQPKNIYFLVRNNNDYPFRNLILFTEIEGIKDTISYDLADISGKWLGDGIGNTKEIKFIFKKNYTFKKTGEQNIKAVQAMRKDTLLGIQDISLIIE